MLNLNHIFFLLFNITFSYVMSISYLVYNHSFNITSSLRIVLVISTYFCNDKNIIKNIYIKVSVYI